MLSSLVRPSSSATFASNCSSRSAQSICRYAIEHDRVDLVKDYISNKLISQTDLAYCFDLVRRQKEVKVILSNEMLSLQQSNTFQFYIKKLVNKII
ncbi:hypothetical protein PPL_09817 [Heterostelium album PN500]|uniref:Uncharacterized protein n=1 Tax=Heterostelium pallidum (strain ATCC 26659 / Pp 5 / PN500) TaxID=670386 RepID=D3BP54_HETP5|nr:hypothetical protein PPL_09817 [Heterostelium album PN500]EFA77064.1 hypothetical protein PPL_09817 [Heterostelium album PN500]|eukprot:XP_020429193.1 hypothetical protein PPL_09817 [Heterostelium album PN500]